MMLLHRDFRWIPESEIKETKKGNRYRLGSFHDGAKCILFPDYCEFDRTIQWYAPTEREIFATEDEEIIIVYKKLDAGNTIDRPEINKQYRRQVIKEVNWKC